MDLQPRFQNKRHRPYRMTTRYLHPSRQDHGLLLAEINIFPNDFEALPIYGLTMDIRADN